MKRNALRLAKYAVSLGLIVLILLRSDLSGFFVSIKEINLLPLGGALLAGVFNIIIRSYKWQLLLRVQGVRLSLLMLQNLNYMSMFFNNFFLGAIGGDVFRIYKAASDSNSKTGTTLSVIMDRATGLCMALFLVLVLGIGFVLTSQTLVQMKQLVTLLMFCLIAGLFCFAFLILSSKLMNLSILNRIPRLKNVLEDLVASNRMYQDDRRTVAMALILSLIYHIGNSVRMYYLTLATHADVSIIPLLFITPLIAVLVMIPVSINGIGVREGSYILFLEQLGVAGPVALLIAILTRVYSLVFSLVGGLLFLIYGSEDRNSPTWSKNKGVSNR